MAADPTIYCLENLTDYRQFERLCTDVMSQSGFPNIEILGGSNDGGRDAIYVSPNDKKDITLFAYSVRADWEQKLVKEDCVRIREEKHKLRKLVFACTSEITSTRKDTVKKKVYDEFGWELELFDIERIRTRLVTELRHLVAQHPGIFSPPFFPTRGGLSISECRDTVVIDHCPGDHALATWLSRRLQLEGHRVWCYGTAPLAGENADDSIRLLINQRAARFLPILSPASLSDPDFVGRCAVASGFEGLTIPCLAVPIDLMKLPSKAANVERGDFSISWSSGLKNVTEALSSHGIRAPLSTTQGKSIALRSYVPQPVTKSTIERVYCNTFPVSVPVAVQSCTLSRELTEAEKEKFRRDWAFVQADELTLVSFVDPPRSVPVVKGKRHPAQDWKHFEYTNKRRSTDVVKELVWRSLDVACAQIGMDWCGSRRVFYFRNGVKPNLNLPFVHVDGRRTRVAATGVKQYGSGDRATTFRYQLCPMFRIGMDENKTLWATMRIYVRVTDMDGIPFIKKAITRRTKKVTKTWWNQEWFARTLAIMQAIAEGKSEIVVGAGSKRLSVSTQPLSWDCPVAIDYSAVELVGDFQEEMASLRFSDSETEDECEEVENG